MLESIPAETPKCHLGKVVKANELVSVVYDVMVKEPENGRRVGDQLGDPGLDPCCSAYAVLDVWRIRWSGEISANP
jgi:hypothetical protein